MSEKVMAAISSLVKERQIPCFCTLHQPRSSVWHLLDSVILMAPGGRICYSGPREKAIHYFACLGFECPDETNPAEYFVDLVSIHPEDPVQATKDSERIEMLADAFAKSNRETTIQLQSFREKAVTTASMKKENALRGQSPAVAVFRVLRRFGALFRRSWRQTIRSKGLNALRLVMSMGTAVLLSQIFPSVAKGPPTTKSVADRICVLSFGVVNMFMVAIMKSIGIFAKEKPVVKREQSRNDYTGLEYIACKALAEIPLDMIFAIAFSSTLKAVTGLAIEWKKLASVFSVMTMAGASLGFWLGSFTKSEESAMATAMPVLILFMVVGIINPSGVNSNATSPFLVGIIKKLSPIAAAIEALCVSEFAGMEFAKSKSIFGVQRFRDLPRMGGLALVKSGNDVLDALGLRSIQYDAVMEYMVALSLLNFGLCWVGLSLTNISWERVQRRCRTFGSRIRGGALFGRGTQGSSSSTSKASDATTRGFNSSSLVVSLKPI
mgnify:CR=1 FL=1